jgi:hypothetical protein
MKTSTFMIIERSKSRNMKQRRKEVRQRMMESGLLLYSYGMAVMGIGSSKNALSFFTSRIYGCLLSFWLYSLIENDVFEVLTACIMRIMSNPQAKM